MAQDNTTGLSRRKLLGGLATVGTAGALGGASTLAFFSDEETYANNQLIAGDLDLKVDWQEHYSDWSADESEGIDTVAMEQTDGLTGFPSTAPDAEKEVYVSDPDQFMRNTAIEAFPDVLSDPADSDATYDALQAELPDDSDICDLPADLDGGDGVLSHPFRTRGTFPSVDGETNPQTTNPGDPLVNISDVKPGDFGEVTFSFHVCGNPAYVWLTGALQSASENGYTEPERKDDDEDGPDDEDTVELLDEIRASFWYDTGEDGVYGADFGDKDAGEGDNIFGTGETLIPLMGTLRNVLTALEDGMFPLDAEPISEDGGGGGGAGESDAPTVSGVIDSSNTYIDEIIDGTAGDDRFGSGKNYTCADYEERIDSVDDVVGSEVLNPGTAPIVEGASYSGCTTLTVDSFDGGDGSSGDITLSSSGPVLIVSIKGGPNGEQVYVFSEPVVLDGATFTTPGDYGVSNVDVCCPVDGGDGGGGGGQQDGERQCFPNSTTAYVGFEWWLPVDHANEIQTDSVSFDLGFYTEQCRHNDGSGMDGG